MNFTLENMTIYCEWCDYNNDFLSFYSREWANIFNIPLHEQISLFIYYYFFIFNNCLVNFMRWKYFHFIMCHCGRYLPWKWILILKSGQFWQYCSVSSTLTWVSSLIQWKVAYITTQLIKWSGYLAQNELIWFIHSFIQIPQAINHLIFNRK